MARAEALVKVEEYISKGMSPTWTWENLSKDVLAAIGVDCGERLKEVGDYAGKVLRGYYPNRQKTWDSVFTNATPEARKLEYNHIIDLVDFEAKYTLANRPVPPKVEKPKEAPPAPPPPPGAPAAAPTPPAPPAPPPPPA